MAEPISIQQLKDASLDVKSLEEVVNGDENVVVTTRLGETYPSVKGSIKTLFENGGLPAEPFETFAKMNTDGASLDDGQLAQVYNETANNGLYVKTAGAWVKSAYDIESISKVAVSNAIESLYKESNNLIQFSDITHKKAISTTGDVTDLVDYSITGFIPVKPDTDYAFFALNGVAGTEPVFQAASLYDASKNFIARDVRITPYPVALKFASNVAYIRLNLRNALLSALPCVTQSSNFTEYDTQADNIIKPDLLPSNVVTKSDLAKYITAPKNLFDSSTVAKGVTLDSVGDSVAQVGYVTSDFIAVEPSKTYSSMHSGSVGSTFKYIGLYDEKKAFIARLDVGYTGTPTTEVHTFNKGVAYIKLSTANVSSELVFSEGTAQLGLSKTATLENTKLGNVALASIPSELDKYIVSSVNLYDPSKATAGYSISVTGEIVDNPLYHISDIIKVEPNAVYTITWFYPTGQPFHSMASYDIDGNFINRVSTTRVGSHVPLSLTMGANVASIRFNINSLDPYNYYPMIIKGTEVPSQYVSPKVILDNVNLSDSILKSIGSSADKYMTDKSFDAVYDFVGTTANHADITTTTSAQVYGWFDTLMTTNSDYMTKVVMGNDAWGNEIAYYRLKPMLSPVSSPSRALPVVFLIGATHGYEKTPPIALYYLAKELCESWRSSDALEAIRFNTEILILPIANPSGWADDTRGNRNGIDINRSFPENFGWQTTDPTSPYYGGAVPLQELESQYISSILTNNKVDLCYDFHTFGGDGNGDKYIWLATDGDAEIQHLGQTLMSRMGRKWSGEYEWLSDDYLAGFSNKTTGAMVQDHARTKGAKLACTFEVSARWRADPASVTYDATQAKTSTEAITNWLAISLQHISN